MKCSQSEILNLNSVALQEISKDFLAEYVKHMRLLLSVL